MWYFVLYYKLVQLENCSNKSADVYDEDTLISILQRTVYVYISHHCDFR